jgi:hypothetical protein
MISEFNDYLPSHNIASLLLYAISTRFLLFDYKITGILWRDLLLLVKEKYELSTKRTKKEGQLIIYSPDVPPNPYWLGLYKVLEKLLNCPFCKGCWSGYIIYLLFVFQYHGVDIRQIGDFAIFSWCCGWLSLISNQKLGI